MFKFRLGFMYKYKLRPWDRALVMIKFIIQKCDDISGCFAMLFQVTVRWYYPSPNFLSNIWRKKILLSTFTKRFSSFFIYKIGIQNQLLSAKKQLKSGNFKHIFLITMILRQIKMRYSVPYIHLFIYGFNGNIG